MVISDRISAYEIVWKGEGGMNGVPGKGAALNAISNHWFKLFKEKGLADSHILDIPHPLVWIVQKARPVMIEAIARQYITGSMWRDYGKGNREFCGIKIPDGLKENQKLDKLLITPSTKGILKGIPGVPEIDDVNVSRTDITNSLDIFNFKSIEHVNDYEKLLTEGFQVISEALKQQDQIFVDTKFEFGYVVDKAGKEKLIYMDEVGTPDSSRIWDGREYRNGKVMENSKEFFRKKLLNHFPDPDILTNKNRMNERYKLGEEILPQSIMMETSKVYADIAEKITGEKIVLSEDPKQDIIRILDEKYGLISQDYKRQVKGMNTTLGVLGGGQLGRMMIEAAHRLGVRMVPLDPLGINSPAGQIAEQAVEGSFKDPAKIRELAAQVDVLTVEIEHVECDILEALEKEGKEIQPPPACIRLIQDKLVQKRHFQKHGVPLGPFVDVPNIGAAKDAGEQFGYPYMLKSRKEGYDGKGNFVVQSASDIETAFESLGNRPCYAEKWCAYEKEVAVMVVRSKSGETRVYPVVDFTAKNSICHTTICPAESPVSVREKTLEIADQAIKSLGEGTAGIFGVELFVFKDGSVTLNEVAPRPHNSGHYTIEACGCDQFEAHVRAVLDMPLPKDTSLKVGASLMVNIIAHVDESTTAAPAKEFAQLCSLEGAAGHWYGKNAARKGRKMAHVTVCARDSQELAARLKPAQDLIGIGMPKVTPLVGVIMGSDSDLPCMKECCDALREFGVPYECTVVSAHRTPDRMMQYAREAAGRGLRCIVAGAGGAAHLPGMVAALTPLPVIGVPVKTSALSGVDSLYSIVQMPKGVPVATVAIGNAKNAGLLAVRMLAGCGANKELLAKMQQFQDDARKEVEEKAIALEEEGERGYLARSGKTSATVM
jgi:phosphoribosylaminoimidazole carboxylase